MLTRIIIENINAIGKCDIELTKGKYKYLENVILNDKIVNPIVIYGHNGSGKSSFISAMSHLVSLMIEQPSNLYPFTQNMFNLQLALDKKNNNNLTKNDYSLLVSKIKLFFIIKNEGFEYEVHTSPFNGIVYENLTCDNKIIFIREINKYVYEKDEVYFKEDLSNLLLLRKLCIDGINNEKITDVYDYLSNIAVVHADRKEFLVRDLLKKSYMDLIVEKSEDIKDLLKKYQEFPLYTVSKEQTDLNNLSNKQNNTPNYFFELETSNSKLQMPYDLMSMGMKNQSLILSILLSLPKHSLLVIDEMEQALHPTTILSFLKVVQEKEIQLIFTCHNTNVMQELRPDQIFFSKWKDGYSTMLRLSDIYPNIREVNNIEKMYLNNVFELDEE